MVENTIQQIIDNVSLEAINQQNSPFIIQIKSIAQNFLNKIDIVITKYTYLLKNDSLKNQIIAVKNLVQADNNATQEIAQIQHQFASQINALLGRREYLTYVLENGDILFSNEVQTGEMYRELVYSEKDSSKGIRGKVGNISSDNRSKFFTGFEEDAKKVQNKINNSIKLRRHIYEAGLDRWDKSIKGLTQSGDKLADPQNYKYNSYYYHNLPTGYKTFVSISSKGRLAQAYVSAVLTEDKEIVGEEQKTNPFEAGLGKLLFDAHNRHDNIAASIEQDIVLGKFEFAVKSAGGVFNTPGFISYIHLAENIKKINDNSAITPALYKKAIAKLTRSHSDKGIAKKVVDALSLGSVQQIQENLKKLGINIQ